MFAALGHFVVRRRKSTLTVFLLFIFLAGGIGSLSFTKLDTGGYSNPSSQSAQAAKYLTDNFHVKDPGVVLVLDSDSGSVNEPANSAAAQRLEALINKEPGVSNTLSFWSAS